VVKARAEERLLAGTFGADCAAYCARTPQFVPGLRRSRRR
jgi:protein-S-isoprenylcysteine O-methyltransferase Ste14